MNKFKFIKTSIPDVKVCISQPIKDERGYLDRVYCQHEFRKITRSSIKQINRTFTKKVGTIRGFHYQKKPYSEIKIIKCVKGKIFDVALDIRKNSSTFLKYHAEIISAENNKIILIPEGFAHGFQTLTENCELIYFHTQFYNKKSESGINLLDSKINIKWPKKISFISQRDKNFSLIKANFDGINL